MKVKEVTIASCTQKILNWNPVKDAATSTFQYIDLSSVDKDSKTIIPDSVSIILGAEAPSRARQIVKEGDILVSTVRPNLNGVAQVTAPYDGATASTGYSVLRSSGNVDSGYLFHWVKTSIFVDDMINKASGASYPAVSDKIVKSSKIPLPPLPTQRRIAAALDLADRQRQLLREEIAAYGKLGESLFLEMFGDPRINEFNWEKLTGEKIFSRITVGVVVKPASYYVQAGIPALRTLNVRPNRISNDNLVFISSDDNDGKLSKSKLCRGDIVVARTGQPGTAAVVTEEHTGCNCIDLIIMRPKLKRISPIYMSTLLNSEGGKALTLADSNGQIQKHFNVGTAKKTTFMIPPLDLQIQFANRIQKIEALKAKAEAALVEANDLFNALLQRAFRGELFGEEVVERTS